MNSTNAGICRPIALCLLTILFTACVGPQLEHDALPDPVRDLYQRLQENPKAVELYPEYIELQLRDGDLEGVEDSLQVCIENNRDDYRAWLVKASTERTLASFGVVDALVRAQASLVRAHKLSQQRYETAQALASFSRETWQFQQEETFLQEALEHAPQEARADVSKTLASFYFKQARYKEAEQLLSPLDQESTRVLRMKLIAAQQGAYQALFALKAEGFQPSDVFVILRLTSSLQSEQTEVAHSFFKLVLNTSEKPEYRFAALLGLWQIAWIDHLNNATGSELPVGIEEMTRRLDDLDEYHPDWIVRAYLMASASNDNAFKNELEARMQTVGMQKPQPLNTPQATVRVWKIDDLRRTGLLRKAYTEWQVLIEQAPKIPEYLIPGWEMAHDLGKYDESLATLALLEQSLSLQPMLWKTRLLNGDTTSAAQELDAYLEAQERPQPSLNWLRAVAELHHQEQ